MNDAAAAQTAPAGPLDLDVGASESRGREYIYTNLRAGDIAQTSNKPVEGWVLKTTHNQAGEEFKFYAKTYGHLTGFVDDIWWHTHTTNAGVELTGWNVAIDTTKDGKFVLGVSSNDRPFQRLMNTLLSVDFERPVMFVGFWGKDNKKRPQKVLLLSQGLNPETRKPIWVLPGVEEKWLSRAIIDKLKEKVELTEVEERNVSRMKDGSFNKDYPYIVQRPNDKWSFDLYEDFLMTQMKEIVIPSVKAAAERRGSTQPPAMVPDEDIPNGDSPASPVEDDDIPF